jgi:adenosylhomocysteine nucleosidase
MVFYTGVLCEKEVVLVRSGIGKVNAAVCTQILVDKFQINALMNTGIAGSLDANINIGDMVISTDLVEHDVDATVLGYQKGEVPRMGRLSFPASEILAEKAVEANREANPDIQTFTGRVVSGDQFISSNEVKASIAQIFQAKCTEMEGAAIAHVAYLNQIPCVIIRAISDKADNSATMDYPTFEKLAIEHSVRLVRNLLPRI